MLAFLFPFPFSAFLRITVLGRNLRCCSLELFSLDLSRLFHCSVVIVLSVFRRSRNSFLIISHHHVVVKNFFHILSFVMHVCLIANSLITISSLPYFVKHFFCIFDIYFMQAEKEGFEPSRRY